MSDDIIKVNSGIIQEIVNIDYGDGVLNFINNDPQLVILFDQPVKGIRMKIKLNSVKNVSYKASVYFAGESDDFNEQNVINFKRKYKYAETESVIVFDGHYKRVRIDLDDSNADMDVEEIVIDPLYNLPNIPKILEKNFTKLSNDEGVLVVTHDLSNTGAPILAFNIAKQLISKSKKVIAVTCSSENNKLEDLYTKNNIPLYKLDDFSELKYFATGCLKQTLFSNDLNQQQNFFLEALRNTGYKRTMVNSVASGKYVKLLKEYDFLILSLIHEMKNTIINYFYEEGKYISQYSDYIVFPDQIVKEDFESIFSKVYGNVYVFPQGVYLDCSIEDIPIENKEVFSILEQTKNKKIILGSGTAELRKGTDLFINAAISLAKMDESFEFVWAGDFYDSNLKSWLQLQIEKSGLSDKIHFIPFISNKNDYKKLLSRACAFWLTSREDPFPSVALEAMSFGVPIFGFKDSGGFNTMADNRKAVIIDWFDISQLSKKTFDYFNEDRMRKNINQGEIKSFLNSLNFEEYVEKIVKILNKDSIIEPDFNIYFYQNGDRKHYFDLQLPQSNLSQKMHSLSKARFKKVKLNKSQVVLLDTKIGSDNIGDDIIMSYCENICNNLFRKSELIHVPTHIYDEQSEHMQDKLKILCGTNILYKEMEISKQLSLPKDMSNMKNVCLLGVGMQELGLEKKPSEYTIKLLKLMLNNNFIHSVRDKQTKNFLESIGIKNVVYTSCPTMWELSPEKCERINRRKSNNVLTTITDYKMDKNNDEFMLSTLKKEYDKVYIWIQGQLDYEYLQQLVNTKEFILVPPTLGALDKVLEINDLDYVGTRLHAGIRSLNKLHRSLIISIDNRAREMAKYTNLPIIEREDIRNMLVEWIYNDQKIDICLPMEEINKWKNQFCSSSK